MNYLQAREMADKDGKGTGLWHYTSMNDGQIWRVGFCRDNCPGHATPEEAAEHYRQYLLAHVRYDGKMSGMQRPCLVCGVWTQGLATVHGDETYVLCDEHRNREYLEPLVHRPDQIISS